MAGLTTRLGVPKHPHPARSPVAAGVRGSVAPRLSGGHGRLHLQPGEHLHHYYVPEALTHSPGVGRQPLQVNICYRGRRRGSITISITS